MRKEKSKVILDVVLATISAALIISAVCSSIANRYGGAATELEAQITDRLFAQAIQQAAIQAILTQVNIKFLLHGDYGLESAPTNDIPILPSEEISLPNYGSMEQLQKFIARSNVSGHDIHALRDRQKRQRERQRLFEGLGQFTLYLAFVLNTVGIVYGWRIQNLYKLR